MVMVQTQSLESPLTKQELKKLERLLHSDELFEQMVERAVKGKEEVWVKSEKASMNS